MISNTDSPTTSRIAVAAVLVVWTLIWLATVVAMWIYWNDLPVWAAVVLTALEALFVPNLPVLKAVLKGARA